VLGWVQGAFQSGEFPPLSREEEAWLLSRYPSVSHKDRLRLRLRIAATSDVLRATDVFFPSSGAFLDAGCGYGFVSHWMARQPRRWVVGVDASERAIAVARSSRGSENLVFRCLDFRKAFDGDETRWSGIAFVDSLLFLEPAEQESLLVRARECATSNGWLIVRDSTTEPHWKLRWTRWEERVKLWRWRYGVRSVPLSLTYRSLDEWRRVFLATGWRIEWLALCGRRTPYPGWLAVCQADRRSVS